MTLIEVEAKRFHCGRMARLLRREHAEILAASPRSIHQQLLDAFNASIVRRAWLLDGELVALVGMVGMLADDEGTIWLALSEQVSAARPIVVARTAQRFIDNMTRIRPVLTTDILSDDIKSRQLAAFLGFSAGSHSVIEGIDTVQMALKARKAA